MVNAPTFAETAAIGSDLMASALKKNEHECEKLREELDDLRLLNSSLLKDAHSKDAEKSGKETALQQELAALKVQYTTKCTELFEMQQQADKEIACMQSELSTTKQTIAMLRIHQNSFNTSQTNKHSSTPRPPDQKAGCCTIS